MKVKAIEIKQLVDKAQEDAFNKTCQRFVITGKETEDIKNTLRTYTPIYIFAILKYLEEDLGIEVEN